MYDFVVMPERGYKKVKLIYIYTTSRGKDPLIELSGLLGVFVKLKVLI